MAQEGVLSDVRSLPFFQDVLTNKLAVDSSKKSKKTYTAPKMCFQLSSACSIKTVHGKNDGKHNNVPEPGVNFCPATKAPAADPSNADQPVVKIASSEDNASSDDGSVGSSNTLLSSNSSSASSSSDEEEQSVAPAGGG